MLQDSTGRRKNSLSPRPGPLEKGRKRMALLRAVSTSDVGPVLESGHVTLRTPQMSDYPEWAALRGRSREFLSPWQPLWASDGLSRAAFRRRVRDYLRDLPEDIGYALLVFAVPTGVLVVGLTLC